MDRGDFDDRPWWITAAPVIGLLACLLWGMLEYAEEKKKRAAQPRPACECPSTRSD